MAKENDNGAARSVADSILEFLPEESELLKPQGAAKAENPVLEPEAETADETEAEVEGTEADAEKAETEESEESDEDGKPVESEKIQKRIDKLTARAKTAEEEREQLKAQVEELKAKVTEEPAAKVVLAPNAENPLADVADAETLNARVANARAVKRWCIENPEGGTVKNAEGVEVEIEPAAARRMLADAEEVLTIHGPKRERFLVEQREHDRVARETYPEMFKKGSEAEKAYGSLIEAWPEVLRFPDHKVVLGDYIAGFNARMVAGKTKPEAAEKPVKRGIALPVPKVTAPKPKVGGGKENSASRVIEQGGTLDALTNHFGG
jgi:chromosome segregation ATPase